MTTLTAPATVAPADVHDDLRPVRRAGGAVLREPATAAPVSGPDEADLRRWYPALVACATGVVAVTFALSYHGLFEFARTIAHLPWALAVLVPVGVDVFSLTALAATFLTRGATWRVRCYAWLIFGATVGVSVAGNALFATADVAWRDGGASRVQWGFLQVGEVVGAALWPMFAAGALHLLIIVRRHLEQHRATASILAEGAEKVAAEEQLQRARAIELVAAGTGCPAIADDLGVPLRTVQRWTAEVRAAMDARPAPAPKGLSRDTPSPAKVTPPRKRATSDHVGDANEMVRPTRVTPKQSPTAPEGVPIRTPSGKAPTTLANRVFAVLDAQVPPDDRRPIPALIGLAMTALGEPAAMVDPHVRVWVAARPEAPTKTTPPVGGGAEVKERQA